MKGFLDEVTANLYTRYGEELAERVVIFPSRRARLFFTDALARIAQKPMWQPQWMTLDEVMSEISGLHAADRVRLITELYKVYARYHDEPFDKFYFWGDMLLRDFDTIDKYEIDAQMLFANLSELKEIEADLSYLSPVQRQIIASFWSSVGEQADLTEAKRRFLAIWRTLGAIYGEFRERLSALGIAYEGMVQRTAAERIHEGKAELRETKYAVVGFNALTKCEQKLFDYLSTAAETDFFWDYDSYYKDNPEQEAGRFLRDNIVRFPPAAALSHDNMRQPKRFTVVSALSNAVQCKEVSEILTELSQQHPLGKETAIVLTDENLLMPLLYAMPPEIGAVNVTMGFPLRQTLAYTFVERLVELQNHVRETTFYHVDVTGLLAHPYITESDTALMREMQAQITADRRIRVEAAWLGAENALLKQIFTPAKDWRALSDYLLSVIGEVAQQSCAGDDARQRVEFLAVVSEELAKLRNSLDACDVELTTGVYISLLRRHLQTVRIPFEGEPLQGVQVMGILETRNLDFENVILLSMNDDNFPGKASATASFIPYNLRAAYSLPTPDEQEAVYAYSFYRLVQRAADIRMLYCAHADDKTTGEPSRYIRQLDYESGFALRSVEAGVDVNLAQTEPIVVAKDAESMRRLERFIDPENTATLSPTAFFRYVACPLRFYFHSIARIKTDDELTDEIDAPMFGTIFHAAAQQLYNRVKGEAHPGEILRAMIRQGEVERAVEAAIAQEYLKRKDKVDTADYSGNVVIVKEIVTRYLKGGVLPYDAAHDGFTTTGIEEEVDYGFPFRVGGRNMQMKFAGRADRIDRLDDGTLRVVDYKTGSAHLEFDGLENLFRGKGKQRLSNIVQTLLYAMMLHRKRGCDAEPALYYVRNMHREDYSPLLTDKATGAGGVRYSLCGETFEELVRAVLTEMYDPAIPFAQCEDVDTCEYCDFKAICRR